EKYEIKTRDWNAPGNIKDYIARLNGIRRENGALQQTANLQFLQVDDDKVTGFLKQSIGGDNAVACAIALAAGPQRFWLHFSHAQICAAEDRTPVRATENLVPGERILLEWGGVRLGIDPANDPALIFRCIA